MSSSWTPKAQLYGLLGATQVKCSVFFLIFGVGGRGNYACKNNFNTLFSGGWSKEVKPCWLVKADILKTYRDNKLQVAAWLNPSGIIFLSVLYVFCVNQLFLIYKPKSSKPFSLHPFNSVILTDTSKWYRHSLNTQLLGLRP